MHQHAGINTTSSLQCSNMNYLYEKYMENMKSDIS